MRAWWKEIGRTHCLSPSVSHLQHAALSQNAPQPSSVGWRSGCANVCERVYIYWRGSWFAANWLLSLRNFLTLGRPRIWLPRTRQSDVDTVFIFKEMIIIPWNVDIAAVCLSVCRCVHFTGMKWLDECVFNLFLFSLARWGASDKRLNTRTQNTPLLNIHSRYLFKKWKPVFLRCLAPMWEVSSNVGMLIQRSIQSSGDYC